MGRLNRNHHGLVPLSDIRFLEGSVTSFMGEFDDVITMFGPPLQRIYIVGLDSHPPRQIHVVQGWVDLPVLIHIE